MKDDMITGSPPVFRVTLRSLIGLGMYPILNFFEVLGICIFSFSYVSFSCIRKVLYFIFLSFSPLFLFSSDEVAVFFLVFIYLFGCVGS